MWRGLIVTIVAGALIGASTEPASNPRAITISVQHFVPVGDAHVALGIAVLGHHVSRIETGWLVKQNGPGNLHVDWSRSGNWDGLTRTTEGPRDVSQAQLDAVVHAIEGLGFAPSAIRAWRVPAPVGYDGFGEGDDVLTIGEILLDLGPVDTARTALQHYQSAIEKDNPFENIPLTNVRYSYTFYMQPDCNAIASAARTDAMTNTDAIAASIASTASTTASFVSYTFWAMPQLLCPQGIQPHFDLATGSPPPRILAQFATTEVSTVSYSLAPPPAEPPMEVLPYHVPLQNKRFVFDLDAPFVATIGTADCTSAFHDSVSSALAVSRRRADALAKLFHARVTRVGAARIDGQPIADKDCKTTVDAAWFLAEIPVPDHALASAAYSADASGPPGAAADDVSLRALLEAGRQAVVDNPHFSAMYEVDPDVIDWNGVKVTATLIVQR